PSGYRWATRDKEKHDTATMAVDQPFSVHADGYALLELVPAHALSRYRLRLQIHHHGGHRDGEVGIYFGYSEQAGADGRPVHRYAAIHFNDITAMDGLPLEPRNRMRFVLQLLFPQKLGQVADTRRQHGTGVS